MTSTTTILDPGAAPSPAPAAAAPAAAPPAAAANPPAAAVTEPVGAGSEEWRKMLAGEDEKSLKLLERYSDPKSFLNAHNEAAAKLTSRLDGMIKLPGEKATDEERQVFAKAVGIPEAPDKYERVKPPEGLDLAEGDVAFIDGAIAKLHKDGGFSAHPEVIRKFEGLYHEAMNERAAQMAAAAVVKARAAEATLRKEWGSEYETNLGLANEAIKAYGDKEVAGLLDKQFADGTTLGAHPGIIRMLANAARNGVEDVNFLKSIVNTPGMGTDAIDTELSQIKKWRHGTADEKQRYADASAPGGRYEQLMAMKQRVSGTQ